MPEVSSYAPGTPAWVDLGSTDFAAAQAFYCGLFGWQAAGGGPGSGGYCMFQKEGRTVAGLAPVMTDAQPRAWTTYVRVADADATVARARRAGADVLMDPLDVLDAGRMALFADPTGASLALWQPRAHHGADVAHEVGAYCWSELQTRDRAAAAAFYGAVFSWRARVADEGPAPYTEWRCGDETVGAMVEVGAEIPPQVPAHWLVHFGVADCDEAVARAARLGGVALAGPAGTPRGRVGVLSDPAGAVFAVMAVRPA